MLNQYNILTLKLKHVKLIQHISLTFTQIELIQHNTHITQTLRIVKDSKNIWRTWIKTGIIYSFG